MSKLSIYIHCKQCYTIITARKAKNGGNKSWLSIIICYSLNCDCSVGCGIIREENP
nr:MAG TPA: hypothetical protein [Caudoviricetes sp.]